MLVVWGLRENPCALPACAEDGFVVLDVNCKDVTHCSCEWAFSSNAMLDYLVASHLAREFQTNVRSVINDDFSAENVCHVPFKRGSITLFLVLA